MIDVKDLSSISIFKELSTENLTAIIPCLAEKSFPAETMIIYRGDPGNSMYMVLDGTVSITLRNDEGLEYSLATLGEGEVFGEMALMTGEPRSANVKAATSVRLAELSQEAFFGIIAAYPELNESLLQLLAKRRAKTLVRQQFANLEREEIIANLLAQRPPEIDHFLGKTKWTIDTNAAIEMLAATDENILILGERGTGKDLAARLIHFHGPARTRPLFHLDCANPLPVQRESNTGSGAEKDPLHLEIAQESALFGHGVDAGSYARGIRKGYMEFADGGALVLENIDSLLPSVQRLLVRFIREGTFVRKGESRSISGKTRLIATSSRSLQELNESGRLDSDLLSLVSSEILHMRPLRERKKDIPSIAEHLIPEYNGKIAKNVTGFSKEALNLLVDYDWPLNVDELRQVVERAVAVTTDGTITESQVFLNIPTFSSTGKFNILRIPFMRRLANYPFFPKGLRVVTVPFILALIILTLIGPTERNPANLIVWAAWWPFLILSILISSRSWCGFCPMPIISDGINSYRKKFLFIPPFLSKYGIWIGIAGFVSILLTEHFAHMFTEARPTSALLLTILGGTTITNFFYGKRSWCKHICPLGKMVANSATLSILELGSNSNVCMSQCQTHDCINEKSCPMGIHPSAAVVSKDCILCLSCVKRCKNQSVRIDLRLPWYEFQSVEKWEAAGSFFAVSLTALVLAVKVPWWGPLARISAERMPDHPIITDVAASLAIYLLFTILTFFASGFPAAPSWKRNYMVTGHAYLFLAFAGFFNIYFHELVYNGPNLLPWLVGMFGLGAAIPAEWITPNLGTLKVLIPLITLAGAVPSMIQLKRLCEKNGVPVAVRRLHQCLIVATTMVFLVILQ